MWDPAPVSRPGIGWEMTDILGLVNLQITDTH